METRKSHVSVFCSFTIPNDFCLEINRNKRRKVSRIRKLPEKKS